MAQFQVYRVPNGQMVLDLQTVLTDTGSRVVAPLISISAGPRVIGRLEPVFEIEGEAHALHTAEMAAIPSTLLRGPPIADLATSDYEIRGALDMIFSGF